jgi:hypothetical protein
LDPIIPSGQVEELAAIFESGGADVAIAWRQGGHELGEDDVRAARDWLSRDKIPKKSRSITTAGCGTLLSRLGLGER